MVFIYLKNGDCIEVMGAVSAKNDDLTLSCLDSEGKSVATFESATVATFTVDPKMAELLEEEVCEDLTTIPAGT